jgi:tRNA/tmRNA/rRNA uracil-C5-methylase (TrmA/RlmC/RlmD family)
LAKNNTALSLFPELAPVDEQKLKRKDHLTFKANRDQGRHGWLRLTPAYSVHLVEELIAQCAPDDLILDPFCGTGTTALVAAEAGIPCHTVDINPFLVWLANAKCANYTSTATRSLLDTADQRHRQVVGCRYVCRFVARICEYPASTDS